MLRTGLDAHICLVYGICPLMELLSGKEVEEETTDEEVEDNKDDEEIKNLEIKKPEGKKFKENKRKEPESTGAIKSSKSSMIEAETEKDCPEGEVLRCPM